MDKADKVDKVEEVDKADKVENSYFQKKTDFPENSLFSCNVVYFPI